MHKDAYTFYILYVLGLHILYMYYIICAHFSFQGRDSGLQRGSMIGCDRLDEAAEHGGAALTAPEQLLLLHVMLRRLDALPLLLCRLQCLHCTN